MGLKKFFTSGAVIILAVIAVNFPFERFINSDAISAMNQKIMEQNIIYLGFDADGENNETPDEQSAGSSTDIFRYLISRQIPLISLSEDSENYLNSQYMEQTEIENKYYKKEPLVLIYHTHATESYTDEDAESQKNFRSKDTSENMCAVGDVMASILYNEYGIEVYHDLSLHDSPSYDASYGNSEKAVKEIMAKYPSIKYVFDVHRDGVGSSDSAVAKYKTTINGTKCAKIMMVVGLNYATSEKNKAFAQRIKKLSDEKYPSLMLSMTVRKEYRFNQFLCENGVLFEVGSNRLTLTEAKAGAAYLARVLAEYIENDK